MGTVLELNKLDTLADEELVPRRRLDRGIDALRGDLVHMMEVTREMVADAMTALVTADGALAQSVILRDSEVDTLDSCIETRALRLVAHEQPMAYDLRFIGTALKVTTDIERMGDHAVNIAKTASRLIAMGDYPKPILEITRMGTVAQELITTTAKAYADDNPLTAQTVVERDDELDVLYREAQTELRRLMREDPAQSVAASHMLFVAHYLERVGDHSANAAERLEFLVTGRPIHE